MSVPGPAAAVPASPGQAGVGQEAEVITSTELRHLPAWARCQLSHILEVTHSWRDVMGHVPAPPWTPGQPLPRDQHYPKKYSSDDIQLITEECARDRREGFEALLEEWGTSGRRRPTVGDLVALLALTHQYRAHLYLTSSVLKDASPALEGAQEDHLQELEEALHSEEEHRSLQGFIFSQDSCGEVMVQPGARQPPAPAGEDTVQTVVVAASQLPTQLLAQPSMQPPTQPSTRLLERSPMQPPAQPPTQLLDQAQMQPQAQPPTQILDQPPMQAPQAQTPMQSTPVQLNSSGLTCFSFSLLRELTNNFSELPAQLGGNKLGQGAFGMVYLARLPQSAGHTDVAIKRLIVDGNIMEQQFRTEIEILSRCQHDNLVGLVGYSWDGADWCLVYDYMSNGSLQDRLACLGGTEPLDWRTRVSIGRGAAQGIVYLHTHPGIRADKDKDKLLVHRDIKSANILLDANFTAKVGDFGLVRLGGSGTHTRSLIKTTTVFGTSAYMAPEAFRGDIHIKMDTFSYGIVLLEILSGLPSYDEEREGCDLLSHIQETEAEVEQLLDQKAGSWDPEVAQTLFSLAEQCTLAKRSRPTMEQVLQQYPALPS